MNDLPDLILQAFPVAHPPDEAELLADFVQEDRPVEAEELRRELSGREWTVLDDEFLHTHSDWLVYLTPRAFAYFLPAWLIYGIDYHRAGYTADWIVSFFAYPPASEPISDLQARMLAALDTQQKSAVIHWITHLLKAYPDDDPGHLKHQGLSLEDAVHNLSLRPYDQDSW